MTWVPLFSVSSQDFDDDLALLKKLFQLFETKSKFSNGYKFSSEAQFAMGWWFYDIYVKVGFIKRLVEVEHLSNNRVKDEKEILKIIQDEFKYNNSKARVKFHGQKPFMARYWSWLMK